MIKITIKETAEVTGGELISSSPDEIVSGFSIDSRTVKPGQLFIAVKGENFDGHDFISEAFRAGAKGFIVSCLSKENRETPPGHVIVVNDTVSAMGKLAGYIRSRKDLPVVCIAGTNGKTTVKDILSHILSVKFRVLASKRSYNNIIGLSLTLFELEDAYDMVILEVGTNHPGEIEELGKIARPNTAIITNIGRAHLESFGCKKDIFNEKASLLKYLSDGGKVFLNGDDPFLKDIDLKAMSKIFFGISKNSDYWINSISQGLSGYDFSVNNESYFVPLDGVHNVYNAAVSVTVAKELGVSYKDIKERLNSISLSGGRLEKSRVNGRMFINDAYNANPDSFECALRVLKDNYNNGKTVVVAGDMLELGDNSSLFHRLIGRDIAGKEINYLVTLGNKAGEIAEGAIEAGMSEGNVVKAKDHQDAARILKEITDLGSTILLKGSRSTKMEEVLRCFISSYTS